MSITDITNKILDDASKEAELVIKNAEAKASEISNTTKTLKENIKKEYSRQLEKTLKENERRITSAAEQEVKLKIDNAKRTAVDNVFKTALSQLLSLKDEEYEDVVLSLFKKLPKETDGKIIAPRERIDATENALKKAGLKYKVETTTKIKGGFIFLGENFESSFVFEEMLRNKKSALEVEVARILFS